MYAERKMYLWQEIDDTPDQAGIYAWYYRHTLADFDIEKLINDLGKLPPTATKEAAARVADFFQTHLFRAFVEESYDAVIKGPLKPTYKGKLANAAILSPGLVERVVAEPVRLWTLKKVLEDAAPEFA